MTLSESFANKIATICYAKFNSLGKQGKPNENQWTSMSCIVQENEYVEVGKSDLIVVALGTGSKCIGRSAMSPKGDVVNDSHSEVICRRAFLYYLYLNLKNSDIFCASNKKYILKRGIKFHFFTTHVLCGDAAIFPKMREMEIGNRITIGNESLEAPTKRQKIETELHKTGAKCLSADVKKDSKIDGLNYHVTSAVRTKPGKGDPTLSMSCSDKFARWIHLGIQGALLSILIEEPIILSSFIISGNTPFNSESFERAIFTRIEIQCNKPLLLVQQSSISFKYAKDDNKQPAPSSIIYSNVPNKSLEVGVDGKKQGITKKHVHTKSARLQICKIELFRTFLDALKDTDYVFYNGVKSLLYSEVKLRAENYQNHFNLLKTKGFKIWTKKDQSLLNFILD